MEREVVAEECEPHSGVAEDRSKNTYPVAETFTGKVGYEHALYAKSRRHVFRIKTHLQRSESDFLPPPADTMMIYPAARPKY